MTTTRTPTTRTPTTPTQTPTTSAPGAGARRAGAADPRAARHRLPGAHDGPTLTTTVPSPIGPLTLTARHGRLTGLHMADQAHLPPRGEDWVEEPGAFTDVVAQLNAYFAGDLRTFDLPLALSGTDFQRRVWEELGRIPYGETRSYGQLAAAAGNPRACRAVGLANGRNPVAVIVPCHRVIGADGTLTGFGGGLDRKAWLLDHERRVRAGAG